MIKNHLITIAQNDYLFKNGYELIKDANQIYYANENQLGKLIHVHDNEIEFKFFDKATEKYITRVKATGLVEMSEKDFIKLLHENDFVEIKTKSAVEIAEEKFEMDHGTHLRNHLS